MARRRGWRQGEVYREPSGRWAVRWREHGRRRYKGGLESKQIADRVLARIMGSMAMDRAGLPPDASTFPTLDELAAEWLDRRQHTHRAWKDDKGRWDRHLSPVFGKLRAPQVDVAAIRSFVEKKNRAGVNGDTLRLLVACLSTMMTDLCERPRETGIERNPCKGLPKNLRRLMRSEHDPRLTPYIRRSGDVLALYRALPADIRPAYALGAFAGLRTGEVLAVEWPWISLAPPRLEVRRQIRDGKPGPLKDDEVRILAGDWLSLLVSALKPARVAAKDRAGLVLPPARGERLSSDYLTPHRLYDALRPALAKVGLPSLTWYQATRHTFASQWAAAGRPLAQLAAILGHSATWVTERYAHVAVDASGPDLFAFSADKGQRMASAGKRRKAKS